MATAGEIRDDALKALRETQRKLNSPAWILALEDQCPQVRRDAARRLLDVQSAKLRLENAELAKIRDGLIANELELEQARTALSAALARLKQVEKVLDAIRGLAETLERVLPK